MPKKKKVSIPVMKKNPDKEFIREWVQNETTQWFLNKLALHLNAIDTVRDVSLENVDEIPARNMAITIIEGALADIWEDGALSELQKRISEEEDNIIKRFKNIKDEF